MSDPFIILGLPRSMTAWVSCFLTCGDVFCQHELAERFPCETICPDIRSQPFPVSGICDSGLLSDWEFMYEEFPDARWIWIERPFRECMESFKKVVGNESLNDLFFANWAQNKQEFLEHVLPRIFTTDELQTEEGARRLWEYVAPNVPLPPAHLAKMMTLKVTVHPKVYAEAANLLNQLTA